MSSVSCGSSAAGSSSGPASRRGSTVTFSSRFDTFVAILLEIQPLFDYSQERAELPQLSARRGGQWAAQELCEPRILGELCDTITANSDLSYYQIINYLIIKSGEDTVRRRDFKRPRQPERKVHRKVLSPYQGCLVNFNESNLIITAFSLKPAPSPSPPPPSPATASAESPLPPPPAKQQPMVCMITLINFTLIH